MRIGELAAKHNINASAIRYYERKGLLGNVPRINGVRVFSPADDARIGFIQLAQQAGFTVAEVHMLLQQFADRKAPQRWRQVVRNKRGEIQQAILTAQHTLGVLEKLLQCECPTLDDCGAGYLQSKQGG